MTELHHKPQTLKEHIKYRRAILKQTCVWSKMTSDEKDYFKASTTITQVESRCDNFIHKYL